MSGKDRDWKCVTSGVGLVVLLGAILSWIGLLVAVLTSPGEEFTAGDHVLALSDTGLVVLPILAAVLIMVPSVFLAKPGEKPGPLAATGLGLSAFWLLGQGGLFVASACVEFYRETEVSLLFVSGEPVGPDLGIGLLLLGVAVALFAVAFLAGRGLFPMDRSEPAPMIDSLPE